MTDQTLKRKGGRPPLPPAPTNPGDCRALIAAETVRTNPSERRLRQWYRLLRTYLAAEEVSRNDERNRLLAEQVRLAVEQLALKKADYRLRFAQKPLGVRQLLTEGEWLKARIAELEEVVGKMTALRSPDHSVPVIDCGEFIDQDKFSESGSREV